MNSEPGVAARVAAACGLALLLALPGAAQSTRLAAPPPGAYPASRAVTGVVEDVNRQLNYVTIRAADTARQVKIDVRRMNTRQSINVWNLRRGDRITITGEWENGDTFQANTVNPYQYGYQPMASSVPSPNILTGVVQSVNRDLNYVMVRDQVTGQNVKIDVRRMDTRQSINVWNLRPGDRITVRGGWENRDTYRANTVNTYAYEYPPMTSASQAVNVLTGVVQDVNRRLNYITVRDRATGQNVKVDVRRMDVRQSINVWNLRSGDLIVVDGGWENRTTFQANRVNF